MMKEEIAMLKSALENNGHVVITPSTNSSSVTTAATSENDEKIRKALEDENNKLRELLKEAQQEILNLSNSASTTKPSAIASKLETTVKDDEISRLKDRVKQLEKELAEKDKAASSIQLESDKLRKDIAAAEAKHSQSRTEFENKLKESKVQSENKLKELEKRLEAEKEEMMDAMALEVEEIEKTKGSEKDKLVAEKSLLERLCAHYKAANNKLSSALQKLNEQAKALSKEYRASCGQYRKELNEMGGQFKSYYLPSLVEQLREVNELMKQTNLKYRKEMTERKRLHNVVQELKGNIRVFMRCRPPTRKELEQFGQDAMCVSFPNPGEVKVYNEKNREKVWEFDEVFDINTKQQDVYEDVSALVTSVLDGFNVCIFAYGQTGSGKTWTMSGPADNRGVNTRALEELFQKASERSEEWSDVITVSMLEVYNENIRDLLAENGGDSKLEVKMGEFGNHVPGLTNLTVDSIQSVFELMAIADKNRSSTFTNMNDNSSRSHMMLTVTIVSEFLPTGAVSRGKLNLVDLAGSERIDKSGATGQALKEAQNINKSLSALGDVIAARAQKEKHIPFRNSTLTFLLQDSLSQDSKTLMIVCISPVLYNAEETFCSLNFASRVRTVELGKASKNTVTAGSAPAAKGGAAPANTAVRRGTGPGK